MITTYETALAVGRAYAWGRQDQDPNGAHSAQADAFARAYAANWQAHHEEWAIGVPLVSAWANFLRDGTVHREHECARCGLTLAPTTRADQDPATLAELPAARRCARCAARDRDVSRARLETHYRVELPETFLPLSLVPDVPDGHGGTCDVAYGIHSGRGYLIDLTCRRRAGFAPHVAEGDRPAAEDVHDWHNQP